MTFNKLLLAFISLCVLANCSSTPKKEAAKESAPKEQKTEAPAVAEPAKTAVPSNLLPAGPVTPNPYLQNTQKFSEQVEVNFHDAVSAIQQKNWNHAESVLVSLAEKNPNLSGVHLNLGIVYRNKGDTEKAAAEFNRAIQTNLRNVYAYNQLAVLKRETGDFAAAETLYVKALSIWPFYADAHRNLAILYDLYLAKPELALPHYQAYQQLLPTADKQVDSWVADLQRRLNGGKDPKKDAAKTETPPAADANAEKAEAK